jgi:hypothetical protein
MIEIFCLVTFSRKLGVIALNKGESKGKWITLFIISWFVAEFLGVFIGLMVFGENSIAASALTGYALAFSSFFIIRAVLSSKPDVETYEQLIDQIGTESVNVD